MCDEITRRREWFEAYRLRLPQNVPWRKELGKRSACPCCGYPTLTERGMYEICELCNWEDDGQDDPNAEEVWGGPNGDYSLSQARDNFKRYLVMYSPENDTRISHGDSERERESKRAMVSAFDALQKADQAQHAELWETIRSNRRILRQELDRKIREYDAEIAKRKQQNPLE